MRVLIFGALIFWISAAQASLVDDAINPAHQRAMQPAPAPGWERVLKRDLSAGDYQFIWDTPPPPGIELKIDPRSLEWIRVRDVLAIPRARATIRFNEPNAQNWQWMIPGNPPMIQPFSARNPAQLSIPLLAHPHIQFHLTDGKETYRLHLEYAAAPFQVYLDPSCSRFDLQALKVGRQQSPPDSAGWMSIGCRYDLMASENGPSANLELLILWQRRPGITEIAGIPAEELDPAEPITLRLNPLSAQAPYESVRLAHGGHEVEIRYRLPPVFNRGNLGLGLGPYLLDFEGGGKNIHKLVAMPTLYGSFQVNDWVRVVAFDATTLSDPWISDLGLYLTSESAKFLDRRFSFNLMLGGHFTAFQARNGYTFKMGLPQGFEIIGTDILKRGYNFALGGFIFPSINGKAYNNLWVRWGTRRLFGEINYILWREDADQEPYFARSVGITLGMPLPFLSFL